MIHLSLKILGKMGGEQSVSSSPIEVIRDLSWTFFGVCWPEVRDSAPEGLNRGRCLCARVVLCGALVRMAGVTPSSPALLFLPEGLL